MKSESAQHYITQGALLHSEKRRRQMQRDSGWKRISKQQQEVAFNRSRHLDVKWKLLSSRRSFPPAICWRQCTQKSHSPLEPDFLRSGRIFAETADVEFTTLLDSHEVGRKRDATSICIIVLCPFVLPRIIIWRARELSRRRGTGTSP